MKKAWTTAVLAGLGVVASASIALAHMGGTSRTYRAGVHPGPMGWMGHHMRGRTSGRWERQQVGRGVSCCRVRGEFEANQEPLTKKQASSIAKEYVLHTGNPNLKVGKMHDQEGQFEVEIVTKREGALVERIVTDKRNGWMCRVY